MNNKGGLIIAGNGANVYNAKGSDIILNSKYPMFKIDTTSKLGYQTIYLYFANDPPEPNGTTVTYLDTQVYKFAHNLSYEPSVIALYIIQDSVNPPYDQPYALDWCIVSSHSASGDSATLFISADSQNVYITCEKYYDSNEPLAQHNPLTSMVVSITILVSINDLSGN